MSRINPSRPDLAQTCIVLKAGIRDDIYSLPVQMDLNRDNESLLEIADRLAKRFYAKAIGGAALVAPLAACATQPAAQPDVPGFAAGFFHGFVAIAALLASLFYKIRIYAFPNGGFWYDAGFVLGFSLSIVLVFLWLLPKIGGFFTQGR